jgi:hypothetical protein
MTRDHQVTINRGAAKRRRQRPHSTPFHHCRSPSPRRPAHHPVRARMRRMVRSRRALQHGAQRRHADRDTSGARPCGMAGDRRPSPMERRRPGVPARSPRLSMTRENPMTEAYQRPLPIGDPDLPPDDRNRIARRQPTLRSDHHCRGGAWLRIRRLPAHRQRPHMARIPLERRDQIPKKLERTRGGGLPGHCDDTRSGLPRRRQAAWPRASLHQRLYRNENLRASRRAAALERDRETRRFHPRQLRRRRLLRRPRDGWSRTR